jgi:hypothetical protein
MGVETVRQTYHWLNWLEQNNERPPDDVRFNPGADTITLEWHTPQGKWMAEMVIGLNGGKTIWGEDLQTAPLPAFGPFRTSKMNKN